MLRSIRRDIFEYLEASMIDVIKGFVDLLWTILCSGFSLYKQITGIKNDLLASLFGASPILITIAGLAISGIKKLIRS